MTKKTYHHGALKEELIKNGLHLIQTQGMESFTMRNVAALSNVSPTAAYKHFESKEKLLEAIKDVVSDEFRNCLAQSVKKQGEMEDILAIGRSYVIYLLEHPIACELLFKGENGIKVSFDRGNLIFDDKSPFAPFYEAAESVMKTFIPDEQLRGYKILRMWCEVHGFAELIANKVVLSTDEMDELIVRMLKSARSMDD